jgi:hypothetical protein
MVIDMAGREYYLSFASEKLMKFEYLMSDVVDKKQGANSYFRQLAVEASSVVTLTTVYHEPNSLRGVQKRSSEKLLEQCMAGKMDYPAAYRVHRAKRVKCERGHDEQRGRSPRERGPVEEKKMPRDVRKRGSNGGLGKQETESAQACRRKPGSAKRKGVSGALKISSNQKGVGHPGPPDITSHRRQERLLPMKKDLPPVCRLLEKCQREDSWCKKLVKGVKRGELAVNKFKLHNKLLCYQPKRANTRHYVVPVLLRPMLLKYLHDCPLSGHFGSFKTWKKVGRQFFWPRLKDDVFIYIRPCDLCRCPGQARDVKGGLHKARDHVAKRYNVGRKESLYKVGDTVVCQVKSLGSKGKGISQKWELKWSKPMVIIKFLKPNVVQLAMAESEVVARKAHVSQLKRYYMSEG